MNSHGSDRIYELAAELFSLLSTSTRLRIVCELYEGEKNVGELVDRLRVSQPNLSQHLGTLYRGGVLARRRAGALVYYRIGSDRAALLCEALREQRDRRAQGR